MLKTFSILPVCQVGEDWFLLLGRTITSETMERFSWSDFSSNSIDVDNEIEIIAEILIQKTCCTLAWSEDICDMFTSIPTINNSTEHIIHFYHSYTSLLDLLRKENYLARIEFADTITYIIKIPYQKYASHDFNVIRNELFMRIYNFDRYDSFSEGPMEMYQHPFRQYSSKQLLSCLTYSDIKWFSLSQILISINQNNLMKINAQSINLLQDDFAIKMSHIAEFVF